MSALPSRKSANWVQTSSSVTVTLSPSSLLMALLSLKRPPGPWPLHALLAGQLPPGLSSLPRLLHAPGSLAAPSVHRRDTSTSTALDQPHGRPSLLEKMTLSPRLGSPSRSQLSEGSHSLSSARFLVLSEPPFPCLPFSPSATLPTVHREGRTSCQAFSFLSYIQFTVF